MPSPAAHAAFEASALSFYTSAHVPACLTSPANTEIVVEKTSESKDYDDFIGDLPSGNPRYAVYDFEYQKGDEGIRNKLCFYTWSVSYCRAGISGQSRKELGCLSGFCFCMYTC